MIIRFNLIMKFNSKFHNKIIKCIIKGIINCKYVIILVNII